MIFQGYHIADDQVIGISPIKKDFTGHLSTHVVLHFFLYTKHQAIKIESDHVHYTDHLDKENPVLSEFTTEYKTLKKVIVAKLHSGHYSIVPTLERYHIL